MYIYNCEFINNSFCLKRVLHQYIEWYMLCQTMTFSIPFTIKSPLYMYRVGQKRKLLILSEYVNKTEKIGGM